MWNKFGWNEKFLTYRLSFKSSKKILNNVNMFEEAWSAFLLVLWSILGKKEILNCQFKLSWFSHLLTNWVAFYSGGGIWWLCKQEFWLNVGSNCWTLAVLLTWWPAKRKQMFFVIKFHRIFLTLFSSFS